MLKERAKLPKVERIGRASLVLSLQRQVGICFTGVPPEGNNADPFDQVSRVIVEKAKKRDKD